MQLTIPKCSAGDAECILHVSLGNLEQSDALWTDDSAILHRLGFIAGGVFKSVCAISSSGNFLGRRAFGTKMLAVNLGVGLRLNQVLDGAPLGVARLSILQMHSRSVLIGVVTSGLAWSSFQVGASAVVVG